jgi:hypothetical protein
MILEKIIFNSGPFGHAKPIGAVINWVAPNSLARLRDTMARERGPVG